MNQRALKTLEYNKIIDKLTALAASSLGKEKCSNLLPSIDIHEIREAQTETSDALSRLLKNGSLSFSGIKDIRPSIMRLEVGSTLSATELLHISSLLNVALRIKTYSRSTGDLLRDSREENRIKNSTSSDTEEAENKDYEDSLTKFFSILEPLSPLNNEIKRCILSEEEIADDASPTLRHIRRTIKQTNDKIREQLNSIVTSSSTQTMLQENIVTMRNGRYCLPIKAEYKNHFNGMVHDQSSSGSTIFIEPMAVVKLNNDLRELAIKEQEEIEKILADLSNQAAEFSNELREN